MIELRIFRFPKAYRERSHRLCAMPNHGCYDRRRVNATRKIGAERRVATHANANGLVKCPFEQTNCIFEGLNVWYCRRKWRREITCRFQRSALPYGIVTGLQLL